MGVVPNQKIRLKIITIQNINIHIVIEVKLYPEILWKITECIGHIKEENKNQQV